jgi:hypothetical protein
VPSAARTLALVAAATASVGIAAAVPASAAAPTSKVTGGNVQIDLNAHTLQAVRDHGIHFAPLGSASLTKGTLKFPITGGTADPPNYKTTLGGGFTYSRDGHSVSVTHIVMNTATHRARADVTGHGTVDVFVLGDPQAGSGGPGKVSFGAYPVKLTAVLTRAVDKALGSTVVGGHPSFGTGATTVTF